MKAKCDVSIGDAVEVEMLRRPEFESVRLTVSEQQQQQRTSTVWMPATVVFTDERQIGVAFSNGERLAVPRQSMKWRMA